MSKKRGRKGRTQKHPPPKRPIASRERERPTVVQAMAENTRSAKERMRARGDRFTELLSKTVEVAEDETYLAQRSGLTPDEHAELLRLAPQFADRYEKELSDRSKSFRDKLLCIEPLPVLGTFMMNNIFGVAGEYFEPLATGRESKVEYVAGCLASVDSSSCSDVVEPSRDLILELTEDVDEIFELAHLANLARGMSSDAKDAETDLRFRSRAHRLLVRGASYAQHGVDLARDVFGALPAPAIEKLGFPIETVIELETQVTDLVQNRVNTFIHGLQDRLIDVMDSAGPTPSAEQLAEVRDILEERPTEALTFEVGALDGDAALLQRALETLSVPLGEGVAPDYQSPWDTSPLTQRPFVRKGNVFMLPVPGILAREMSTVLEPHVKPHLKKFKDWKAKRLDEIAVSHLQRMLPGSRSWTNLFYWLEEEGKRKRVELDGLVLYQGIAFLLEGKANPLAPPSLRGDVRRLRNEIKETVEEAFHQALRARRYLMTGEVTFEDEHGNVITEIDGAELDRIYIVNPTLHELGDQAVQLGRFHELGLFKDGTLPFSVFVNDLRVISEIVEIPMEFIHYLEWRARLPLGTKVDVSDELDLFGAYLVRQQMDRMIPTFGHVQVGNQSTDFDDYYMGQVPRKKRPRMLTFMREMREFLERISRERPEGWMDAIGTCLELSIAEMGILSGTLRRMPAAPTSEMLIGVHTEDPLGDSNGGGVSLAIVVIGTGIDEAEVRGYGPSDLPEVQRTVFVKRSSRGRPMIIWATTNREIEVVLDVQWPEEDSATLP
jgi:hypothetical protein